MNGHHLIMGELTDIITGETLPDTHDERYRQQLAQLLIEDKGYRKEDIVPRVKITAKAGEKAAIIKADLTVRLEGRFAMLIKYGPGSLVTRRRSTLAASRIIAPYQIPVVVVTNGEDAETVDGFTGKILLTGLDGIPEKEQLRERISDLTWRPIAKNRIEKEGRIFYAFEVDGSCPCDDTICHLPEVP